MKGAHRRLSALRPHSDPGSACGRNLFLRHAPDAPDALAPPQGSRPGAWPRSRPSVADWDGGTRIAESLAAFLAVPRFSRASRGALVVVLSDGLERGDAVPMAHAVRRLAARSWRLAWLTPLAADPAFRPETAALQAILPIVDYLGDGSGIGPLCDFLERSASLGSDAAGRRPQRRTDRGTRHMETPVIDAHHHIWRKQDLPWLEGPMLPRIFGPYEPIRRDYPIAEYLADIAGSGVVKSVYVQANWAPANAEAEVAWVQKTADETGWPHAIVGYADLMADDVRPALDRLKRYPLLRGIRMQLHWHENPQYRFAKTPDLACDPTFRRNFAALARIRIVLRPAGVRGPDGGRCAACRRIPEDHLHPAARRHAGGSFRCRPRILAAQAWPISPPARTSCRSCRASAHSSTATTRRTLPGSSTRR